MQLLELTPAETAFLAAWPVTPDHAGQRLTQRLAAVLTARLRLPVQAQAQPVMDMVAAATTPVWQPDAALASLWLIRRLGGRHVQGVAPFVPRSLMRTLDEVLAECWLDSHAPTAVPAAFSWQLMAGCTPATLAVSLPHSPTEMTHWARGVIRHG